MIKYLEELEKDLVDAIERREAQRRARRMRWLRLPRFRLGMALAAAVTVAVVAIAGIVAVVGPQGEKESAAPPPKPAPAPIPPGTPLRVVGFLTRLRETEWRGQAGGPGGAGVLTLNGPVDLTQTHCCEVPRRLRPEARNTIRFRWSSPSGVLSGCVVNTVLRRPHGRWVWDGPGRVTGATGALRRYRRRAIGLAGETRVATPRRARIILSAEGRPPIGRC